MKLTTREQRRIKDGPGIDEDFPVYSVGRSLHGRPVYRVRGLGFWIAPVGVNVVYRNTLQLRGKVNGETYTVTVTIREYKPDEFKTVLEDFMRKVFESKKISYFQHENKTGRIKNIVGKQYQLSVPLYIRQLNPDLPEKYYTSAKEGETNEDVVVRLKKMMANYVEQAEKHIYITPDEACSFSSENPAVSSEED